jgi:Putative zinc-finger
MAAGQEGSQGLMTDEDKTFGEGPEHPALLPWYAAGTLDAVTARRIEEHLQGCASCRLELEALASLGATLRRHDGTDHIETWDLMSYEQAAPALAPDRAGAIRRHLAACVACTEELETLRSARRELRESEGSAATAPPTPGPSSGRSDGWKWAFYAAAAAAVVLALPALRGLRPAASPPVAGEIRPVRLPAPTRDGTNDTVLTGSGPWAVEVMLPFGAPGGEYVARIVPRGHEPGAAVGIRVHATTDGRLGLFLPSLPEGDHFQLTAASLSEPGKSYDYSFTKVAGGPDDGRGSLR